MANLTSPYWNLQHGVCEKHMLPQIPCPQCIAEKDKDMELKLSSIEKSGMIGRDEMLIPSGFEDRLG